MTREELKSLRGLAAKATEDQRKIGRSSIAELARADNELLFAKEVLAGCWDHRNDVMRATVRAMNDTATKETAGE